MKKNSLNRIIFNEGLNTLTILVFVVFVVYILKYFLNVYLGVVLSGEVALFFGIFMTLLIVIYDYI
ncbi:hypothetical protein NCU54_19950, partial [Acinetobacter baumannii]